MRSKEPAPRCSETQKHCFCWPYDCNVINLILLQKIAYMGTCWCISNCSMTYSTAVYIWQMHYCKLSKWAKCYICLTTLPMNGINSICLFRNHIWYCINAFKILNGFCPKYISYEFSFFKPILKEATFSWHLLIINNHPLQSLKNFKIKVLLYLPNNDLRTT